MPSADQLRALAGPERHPGVDPRRQHQASPPLPTGPGPCRRGDGAQHHHLRQGREPDHLDRQAHALLDRHPPARARPGHRRRIPRSATAGASASRSPPSLAVMLRSIGIPAREAVGYVPGPYNPITDLYDIQAKDAHAWVQVCSRATGGRASTPPRWCRSPTRHRARPCGTTPHRVWPGSRGSRSRSSWRSRPVTALVVVLRRRRPRTWAEKAARSIEAAGRRAGRRRPPDETLTEYATAIDRSAGDRSGTWQALAAVVEASAYGGRHPSPEDDHRILVSMRALRSEIPRAGVLAGTGPFRRGDAPACRRSSPPPREADGTPSADGDG